MTDGQTLKCNACGYEREMPERKSVIIACKQCGSKDVTPIDQE